uniref:transmembrane protein 132D-like n=1 Tax=Myxine glutinosa TaxID=7769 RepID=UPI00358E2AE3
MASMAAIADLSDFISKRQQWVTRGCEMLYIDGTEKQGSHNARVYILYEEFSQSIELTVWFPRLPLLLEISDPELNQIKNWRIPILKDKRRKRGIFDFDADGERKVRGCSLQFQHALLKVWTMFQTVSGSHHVIPFLGPDWLVDVTELVRNNMTVTSKGVVRLRGGTLVIPEDPGKTSIKVVSPLTGATLGERTVRVSEDKVSISRLHVQLISGVQLSIGPSAADTKVLMATTAVQLNPHRLKQECALSMWLQYSDGTTVPLNVYNRAEYILSVSSLDERVASVDQAQHSPWPVVIVEGKGQGYYINVEVNIDDACLKQKRKTTLVSNLVYIRHLVGENNYHVSALDHQEKNKSVLETFTLKSHFSLDNAGIVKSTTATSFSGLNNHTAVGSIPGAMASDAPEKGLQTTPTSLKDSERQTQTPVPEDEDRGHRNHPVGTPKRGMSDLQIGMYTLLGVFCLAIVLFMANCIKLALKPKCKERRQQQEEEVNPSHEWVCLENTRRNTKGDVLIPLGYWQAHRVDRRQGGHQVESLTLESSTPSQQRRAHRLNRRKDGHNMASQASPSTERKRVTFSTLTVSNDSTDTPFHFSL